jgi:hypothetical protein
MASKRTTKKLAGTKRPAAKVTARKAVSTKASATKRERARRAQHNPKAEPEQRTIALPLESPKPAQRMERPAKPPEKPVEKLPGVLPVPTATFYF